MVSGAETLTSLNYDAVANTLTYKDEEGNDTVVALTDLVSGAETLTVLNYDDTTNVLTYSDEEGTVNTIDLSSMVSNNETNTSLSISSGQLIYNNEAANNGTVDLISADPNNALVFGVDGSLYVDADLAVEPWFVQGTTDKATLNSDNIFNMGNVGIGTNNMLGTSNANVKLAVNGAILTTNSIYADYVFEEYFNGFSEINSEYDFKTLDEVAEFISENNHLPGVTSISDLGRNDKGEYMVNISELSVQILEKVEELYLHTIDQKNTIKQKEQRIEELEMKFEELNKRLLEIEKSIGEK